MLTAQSELICVIGAMADIAETMLLCINTITVLDHPRFLREGLQDPKHI